MRGWVHGNRRRRVFPFAFWFLLLPLGALPLFSVAGDAWTVAAIEAGPMGAESSLHSMAMDQDGMIWAVQTEGLLRFDGRKACIFDPFFLGFAPSEKVRLQSDSSGRIWLHDEQGTVLVFDGQGWRKWREAAAGAHSGISAVGRSWHGAVLLVMDGRIWSGDEPGVALSEFPKSLEGGGGVLHQSADGCFWFVRDSRVWIIDGKAKERLFLQCDWDVEASCVDADGVLYLAGRGQIRRVKDSRDRIPPAVSGSWTEPVARLVPDPGGRGVWLGTRGDGLWRFDTKQGKVEKCLLYIEPLFISDIVVETSGTMWLATLGGGLMRAAPQAHHSLVLPQDLGEAVFGSDHNGTIWGIRQGEIWRKLSSEAEFVMTGSAGRSSPQFWIQDEKGGAVLVCEEGMVRPQDNGKPDWLRIWSSEFRARGAILAASFAADGTLWLSHVLGVSRIQADSAESFLDLQPCVQSSLGVSANGVLILRDGTLYSSVPAGETEAPRQISNPPLQEGLMALSAAGDRFLGLHRTAGTGVFTDSQWLPFDFGVRPVSEMLVAKNKELWLKHGLGVTCVDLSCFDREPADGLPRPVTHFPFVSAAADQWGVGGRILWWKRKDGLSWYDCVRKKTAQTVNVSLEKVYVNGREQKRDDWMGLAIRQEDLLQLQFLVPRLLAEGELHLWYRLPGSKSGWQSLSSAGDKLLLTGLKPGRHQIETAVNAGDGCWQEKQLQLLFTVDADHGLWLLPLSVALFLAVGFLGLWRRYRGRGHASENSHRDNEADGGKYSTSGLSAERAEEIRKTLMQKMESERPYLQASLTLRRLADSMGVHANHLSQVINSNIGLSSKEFINQFRIKAAAARLDDPAERSSIIDVAYDCGFYSKSVFNAAFKKMYGMTPSEYRNRKKGRGI